MKPISEEINTTITKLFYYCQQEDWKGYDPYDALNSVIIKSIPFLNNRVARLVCTQLLKRSPINVRAMLIIPKTQNPKAIALFLSSFINLSKSKFHFNEKIIYEMLNRLKDLRSKHEKNWCWGYSFPWQTRTILRISLKNSMKWPI